MVRKLKPKPRRSIRHAIAHFRHALTVKPVTDDEAIQSFGSPSAECLPGDTIRVSIWNLCKGAGKQQFEHDLQILMQRSDLIMTQEALLIADVRSAFRFPG